MTTLQHSVALTMTLQYSAALLTDMVFYQKYNYGTVEIITDDNTVVQRGVDDDIVVQCGVANRHGILSKT